PPAAALGPPTRPRGGRRAGLSGAGRPSGADARPRPPNPPRSGVTHAFHRTPVDGLTCGNVHRSFTARALIVGRRHASLRATDLGPSQESTWPNRTPGSGSRPNVFPRGGSRFHPSRPTRCPTPPP